MSVKEFWEDEPELFWAYRFSYISKMKMEQEKYNSQAWLQGAYIFEAVSVALSNAFSKGQKIKYSEKPYELGNKSKKEEMINLQLRLKNRVSQVQKIFGGENE